MLFVGTFLILISIAFHIYSGLCNEFSWKCAIEAYFVALPLIFIVQRVYFVVWLVFAIPKIPSTRMLGLLKKAPMPLVPEKWQQNISSKIEARIAYLNQLNQQ